MHHDQQIGPFEARFPYRSLPLLEAAHRPSMATSSTPRRDIDADAHFIRQAMDQCMNEELVTVIFAVEVNPMPPASHRATPEATLPPR